MRITKELKKTWAQFFSHGAVAIFATGSVASFFSDRRDFLLIGMGLVGSIVWMLFSSLFASFIFEDNENDT